MLIAHSNLRIREMPSITFWPRMVIERSTLLLPAQVSALLGRNKMIAKFLAHSPLRGQFGATTYYVLYLIIPHLTSRDVFVDLGCGDGRALAFVAGKRRLRKAIGIEIVPDYARLARQRVGMLHSAFPISVRQGDAANADISEGTVYYLFNPFGEKTMRSVLVNIKKSLSTAPRFVRIFYYNPRCAGALDGERWLRRDRVLERQLAQRMGNSKNVVGVWVSGGA